MQHCIRQIMYFSHNATIINFSIIAFFQIANPNFNKKQINVNLLIKPTKRTCLIFSNYFQRLTFSSLSSQLEIKVSEVQQQLKDEQQSREKAEKDVQTLKDELENKNKEVHIHYIKIYIATIIFVCFSRLYNLFKILHVSLFVSYKSPSVSLSLSQRWAKSLRDSWVN